MKWIILRKTRVFRQKIFVEELGALLSVKSSESDHRKQQFDRTDSFTRIERYFVAVNVCCARETPARAVLSRAPGHTDKPSQQKRVWHLLSDEKRLVLRVSSTIKQASVGGREKLSWDRPLVAQNSYCSWFFWKVNFEPESVCVTLASVLSSLDTGCVFCCCWCFAQ